MHRLSFCSLRSHKYSVFIRHFRVIITAVKYYGGRNYTTDVAATQRPTQYLLHNSPRNTDPIYPRTPSPKSTLSLPCGGTEHAVEVPPLNGRYMSRPCSSTAQRTPSQNATLSLPPSLRMMVALRPLPPAAPASNKYRTRRDPSSGRVCVRLPVNRLLAHAPLNGCRRGEAHPVRPRRRPEAALPGLVVVASLPISYTRDPSGACDHCALFPSLRLLTMRRAKLLALPLSCGLLIVCRGVSPSSTAGVFFSYTQRTRLVKCFDKHDYALNGAVVCKVRYFRDILATPSHFWRERKKAATWGVSHGGLTPLLRLKITRFAALL